MSRCLPLVLLLLPLIGCQPPGATLPTLRPVKVDEAAAYPSQEPGIKPPILTGFLPPHTKSLLADGYVQLFDGTSTYGWIKTGGKDSLSVKENDSSHRGLTSDKTTDWDLMVEHRFAGIRLQFEGDELTVSEGNIFNTSGHSFSGTKNSRIVTGIRVRPHVHILPVLTESDWKPVAGASEAKWSDGVLELTGGVGMVESVKEYGDFILQLEYFTPVRPDGEGINSGLFFRCIPGEMLNGYKCQIFNSPPDEYYARFIGADTGGILRQHVGRNVGAKDGEWNYLTIAARGADVAIWVNGIQVTDWTDKRAEHDNPRNGKRLQPGTIQLQGHDPEMTILFRNMRIAEM
ncbi:MAG: DUF1080 domain-containing protein [Planctomycetaceae bacterium]|nr:DUF1080 domain-containing protein [Planctomycetaceae bacterium]